MRLLLSPGPSHSRRHLNPARQLNLVTHNIPTMNRLLLLTVSLAAGVSALAQGFFNASNNYIPTTVPPSTTKAFVYGPDGTTPLAKVNGRVQILTADLATTLSPGGDAGVAFGLAGVFFVNDIQVPGVAVGGTANIVVRAWDVTTGATWAAATTKGSVPITVTGLGGGTTPNATFQANSNWGPLTLQGAPIIPEPSTIALATLGVAGLFFVARRKK